MGKLIHFVARVIFWGCITTIGLFIAAKLITGQYTQPKLYTIETAPDARVAIVFGAGIRRDGTPTAVLRDRIETAASLYFSGKVEKLLMSGDNRFVDYNEPGAMQAYAETLGVPPEAVVLDFAGRRTYDTCYRARYIFGVKEALLVTQQFHLPRAVYTCNMLGLESVGVSADKRVYTRRSLSIWNLREVPASFVAVWEVWISRPLPVLGKPEPIFKSDELTSLFSN